MTDHTRAASTRRFTFSAGHRYWVESWSREENERFFGNVGVKLRDNLETRFYLSAVHSDSQLPGSITKGQLAIGSLNGAGFASGAMPDWNQMEDMKFK